MQLVIDQQACTANTQYQSLSTYCVSLCLQADLAPMQDGEDVKRPREENGHANGHAEVHSWGSLGLSECSVDLSLGLTTCFADCG